jgi:hypothetical protein
MQSSSERVIELVKDSKNLRNTVKLKSYNNILKKILEAIRAHKEKTD